MDEGNSHVHMDRSGWRNHHFTRIRLQHCYRQIEIFRLLRGHPFS